MQAERPNIKLAQISAATVLRVHGSVLALLGKLEHKAAFAGR